jgi:hypothetical protein
LKHSEKMEDNITKLMNLQEERKSKLERNISEIQEKINQTIVKIRYRNVILFPEQLIV